MSEVNVKCMKNGPLEVSGEISITDDKGQVIKDGQKAHYLCRCGASAKKPFCDGSHTKVSFTS
ncbi:MAG: CDGSH iron-sulfur domain-containing protein [Leptospirillia bacterium]